VTPRQVGVQELLYVERAQAATGNVPILEPPTKVFHDEDVLAHPSLGVPSRVQIRDEAPENYAKVTGRHSATNRCTLEESFDQGEIQNTLFFHRFRQASSYASPRPDTNSKSLCRTD
jgi:hypothetical protein